MARATKTICMSCEQRIDAGVAFCEHCGKPTEWATHDERVQWEVQQWRTQRSGSKPAVHAPSPPTPRKRPARDIVPEKPAAQTKTEPAASTTRKTTKKRLFGRKKDTVEAPAALAKQAVVESAGDLAVVRTPEPQAPAAVNGSAPVPSGNGSHASSAAANGKPALDAAKERQIAHLSEWEREAIARRERARAKEKLSGATPASSPAPAPEKLAAEKPAEPEAKAEPITAEEPVVDATPTEIPIEAPVVEVTSAEPAVEADEVVAPAPAEKPAAKKKTAKKPAAKKKTAKKPAAKKKTAKKPAAKRTAKAPKAAASPDTPAPVSTLHEELLAESVKILRTIGDQMSTLNKRIETLETKLDEQPKRRGLFRRG